MNKTLEFEGEKGDNEKGLYEDVRKRNKLWPMDKLVNEFRRLFTDKTIFMSIYSNAHLLPNKYAMETAGQRECTFRPSINNKSKQIDVPFLL